ncbi:MAG: hypothetical protein GXY34_05365 [Syntrophomonadaceae bacterium]|nr:hypothetical protein [Syntrophomonadaceae bacterium]
MAGDKVYDSYQLQQHYQHTLAPRVGNAPWVLRITELKDKPSPVLVVKERFSPDLSLENTPTRPARVLRDRGLLYGQSLRRCLKAVQAIAGEVVDEAGIPMEIQRYIHSGQIEFRGNLPLDTAAGCKLALIFKLQERVNDQDRVELIAWRVERFTPEEAAYWLTRATQYGAAGNRWAQAGMRIMLGGQPGDPAIPEMLANLRK